MSKIRLNIIKDSKASSTFRFSPLNANKIVFAANAKPSNVSRRV